MCTTFCLKNNHDLVVGNNEDIFIDRGAIFTNQRNIAKTALIMPPEEPMKWVSKYGSITFSQVGKEFPSAGMNETGLVVEQMTLPETRYPGVDNRPAIQDLQLIQYLLDTCSMINQVIECASLIRVSQSHSTIHYLICDQNGDIAILEYINGDGKIYTGKDLSVAVLANSSYQESLRYLSTGSNLNEGIKDNYKKNSLGRFVTAEKLVKSGPPDDQPMVEFAFDVLKAVSRDDTVWSFVYDLKNMRIHFRTKKQPQIKIISMKGFDFANNRLSKVLNINCVPVENLESSFDDYSFEMNRELAGSFLKNEVIMSIFNINFTDEMIDYFAGYPDRMGKL